MYPSGGFGLGCGNWLNGGTSWTVDYPRGDRTFAVAIRRLTRIDGEASKIREYLLRGGFMVCDSFFGTQEWEGFVAGMRRIFPDREIVDLPEEDAIFHTAYDVKERYQVGDFRSMLHNGNTYRADGSVPYWRGVRDDKGRASWWPSRSTTTSAIPGNWPTIRSTRRNSPSWGFAWE